jgi:uncharacterized membrane protein YphA (DoxX/SURF4 family)
VASVLLLIALRLALGWHFLYEGVWKIEHPDEFAVEADMFLSGARGPLAPMFRAMVDDIDGRRRLGTEVRLEKDSHGKEAAKDDVLAGHWDAFRQRFVARYGDLSDDAKKVYDKHLADAEKYLTENMADIQAYLAALERFDESKKANPNTDFQKKRDRETMQKLRGEAKVWLAELDAHETAYKSDLRKLLDDKQRSGPDPLAAGWNPFRWTRNEQISFAITYGLTAIGICLMLGFCTRLAALGGGIFMAFVVMSQPSFPGVIPPDPPQLGHALLVNKDFVEMVALFFLATVAAGRWGGLDYFLHRLFGACCCRWKTQTEEKK